MQYVLLLSAMLFIAVTPYMSAWDAPDLEWTEEIGDDPASPAPSGDADRGGEADQTETL